MTNKDLTYLTFDTETTGLDTSREQIIEITIQLGFGESKEIKTRRIKPTIPISVESSDVHGIKIEDLVDCPTFNQVGKSLRDYFESADVIIGYNVQFDLKILQAELVRNGLEPIKLNEKYILDPLRIWQKMKPRKLVDAYQEFCGKELVDAHSAEADVIATAEVYEAMIKDFKIDDKPLAELAGMSFPPEWIGLSNQLIWENNVPVFNFGKAKGQAIWKFLHDDSGYYEWMKKSKFDSHIIQVCEQALNNSEDQFSAWIREAYPNRIE